MEDITAVSVGLSYGFGLAVVLMGYFFFAGRNLAPGAPPSLPVGKVPTWFYRSPDVLGFIGLSGIFFLMMYLPVIMEFFGGGLPDKTETRSLKPEDILFSIGFQVFTAGIAVALVAPRMNVVTWLGLAWKKWPLVIAIAPVSVLMMWAIFAGLQAVGWMELLEKLGVKQMQDAVMIFQEEKNMVVIVLMAIAATIVAPICEEIVFRGYLYPVAKRFAGPWAAGIATALIFSAVHGSMSALLPLFIFGMVLVFLYEFTGSIWAPMAVHCLFNSATVAIQLLMRSGLIPDVPVQ